MRISGLKLEIVIYLFALIATVCLVFILQKPAMLIQLLKRCMFTMAYALSSLVVLYYGVKFIIDGIFFLKTRWPHNKGFIHLFTVFIFLLIVSVNVFPMVFWIKWLENPFAIPLYLIFSNMLLYYFTLHSYREILDESKKLYVTTARFKYSSAFDYLSEKRQWVMLNNIRPMFYHIFSFTLFTDIMILAEYPTYQGIVGYVFVELKESSSAVTIELIIALLVTALFIYPMKRLLEMPEQMFNKQHHLDMQK